MNDIPPSSAATRTPEATRTSARKAEANRRNARKSTGPRTERGKSWSRLNALKHGILASQAVIAVVEGREERKAFEATVDGLALDFAPVGTFEQVLVQQIAACFWRQRRLLRFENRAAFQSLDARTYRAVNQPDRGYHPVYKMAGDELDGVEVMEKAGLGLDLPSEADLTRLVRYEASITRSLRNALAQLNAHQKARRESKASPAHRAPSYQDRKVVVDTKAIARNRGAVASAAGRNGSRFIHWMREQEEEEDARAEQQEQAPAVTAETENDQTKPNTPEDTEALLRHERLIQTVDRVLKLTEGLAPQRNPDRE